MESYHFDHTLHETENIKRLVDHNEKFELPRSTSTKKNRIGLIATNRYIKRYPHWKALATILIENKYDIRSFGDDITIPNYYRTETIKEFKRQLEQCEFIICYEGFGMHLADLLNIPMIVLWGSANYIRCKPLNRHWPIFGYDTDPYVIIEQLNKVY